MLLKIKDVCCILKISRNTLYKLQKKDRSFPKPIKFGNQRQGAIFYRKDEIENWILSLNSAEDNSLMEGEK